MAPHMKDIVCGRLLTHDEVRNQSFGVYEYGIEKFAFCSKECKENFEKGPEPYYVGLVLWKHEFFRDPVCAKEMDHKEAVNAFPVGYSMPDLGFGISKHRDAQFFFHAESCKKTFDADPEKHYQDWTRWREEKKRSIENKVREEGKQDMKHLPGFDPDSVH